MAVAFTAPQNVVAVAGDQEVTATWTPPASVGGYAVTSYTAELRQAAGLVESRTVVLEVGPIGSLGVTFDAADGVDNDADYFVRVYATNALSDSDAADSNTVTPQSAATSPGAPQDVAAVIGNEPGTIAVTWEAPASDGGSTITHYRIIVTPV